MKLIHRRIDSILSIRSEDQASTSLYGKLGGYVAKFEVESEVLFDPEILKDKSGNPLPFVEILDSKVFDRTLVDRPDVRALYNHDTSAVLGRTKSGTLLLGTDEVGLHFLDDLPNTIDGQRSSVLVGRGDIDGCSFGFQIVEHEITLRPGMPAIHRVYDVDLFEVSIAVAFPAYTQTEVSVRNRTNRGTNPGPTPLLDRRRLRRLIEGF